MNQDSADERHAPRERWHVGKEIPLAMVLTIMLQSAAAIWWARGIDAKGEDHERRLTTLEREREGMRAAERLAVIEATVSEIRKSQDRVEQLLQSRVAR